MYSFGHVVLDLNISCGYTSSFYHGKGSLPRETHKSCVTAISQGKFNMVYFHGYIKKNKGIAHDIDRGK